jgi:hypothetical protein
MLEDSSAGEILPAKAEELAEEIEMKVVKAKPEEVASAMTELRDAYLARQQEQEEGKQPASKKLKSVDTARLDAYGKNQHLKVADLGDVLQWNRQYKTGKKDYLMEKVIDGEVNGRLARCPLCTGYPKLKEDGATVVSTVPSTRQPAKFNVATGKPSEAPRSNRGTYQDGRLYTILCDAITTCDSLGISCVSFHLLDRYSVEPTEEENTEIDRLIDEASGKEDSSATDPEVAELVKAAKKLEWNLSTRKDLKESTGGMVDLLLKHDGKKVDIPQDRQEAIKKIGPLIVANREKEASEIIPVIVMNMVLKAREKSVKGR